MWCRRSKSATGAGNMLFESLPLLHQAPAAEQNPVLQSSKDKAQNEPGNPKVSDDEKSGATSGSSGLPGAVIAQADDSVADSSGTAFFFWHSHVCLKAICSVSSLPMWLLK